MPYLISLCYKVDGPVEEITTWAAEIHEQVADVLDMELEFAGIDKEEAKQHIEFVGVFITKGIK